jgi:hypothetical protein
VGHLDEAVEQSKLTLIVPGGLAGQLFAVGYGAWISKKRGEGAHIIFYDVSTSISKFGVQGVLDSHVAKSLGITYSLMKESWPPRLTKSPIQKVLSLGSLIKKNLSLGDIRGTVSLAADFAFKSSAAGKNLILWGPTTHIISPERIKTAPAGSVICGYPTDYRIIEESWDLLASMIAASSYPDFAHETGRNDTVAVHWRLGDYVQNECHGAVAWRSLSNCLKNANKEEMPVRIFTDSPDLAERTILKSQGSCEYEIVSNDIWSDLFSMTRSRVFIGSHSGVSFLAALALRSDNPLSVTCLPDAWFLAQNFEHQFHLGPKTAEGSSFYPADLVTSAVPL